MGPPPALRARQTHAPIQRGEQIGGSGHRTGMLAGSTMARATEQSAGVAGRDAQSRVSIPTIEAGSSTAIRRRPPQATIPGTPQGNQPNR